MFLVFLFVLYSETFLYYSEFFHFRKFLQIWILYCPLISKFAVFLFFTIILLTAPEALGFILPQKYSNHLFCFPVLENIISTQLFSHQFLSTAPGRLVSLYPFICFQSNHSMKLAKILFASLKRNKCFILKVFLLWILQY